MHQHAQPARPGKLDRSIRIDNVDPHIIYGIQFKSCDHRQDKVKPRHSFWIAGRLSKGGTGECPEFLVSL